jgi:hypothetical protein
VPSLDAADIPPPGPLSTNASTQVNATHRSMETVSTACNCPTVGSPRPDGFTHTKDEGLPHQPQTKVSHRHGEVKQPNLRAGRLIRRGLLLSNLSTSCAVGIRSARYGQRVWRL